MFSDCYNLPELYYFILAKGRFLIDFMYVQRNCINAIHIQRQRVLLTTVKILILLPTLTATILIPLLRKFQI